MSLKPVLLFLFAASVSACGSSTSTDADHTAEPTDVTGDSSANEVATDTSTSLQLQPLHGSGLRFDGVYDQQAAGDLHYFMRFFERGNVALVAGVQKPDDPVKIQDLLTVNAQSGTNNLHNVPVTVRGDSILFSTMTPKGAITYAGTLADGDTLRFLKASMVTGKKAVLNYAFHPDSPLK